MVYRGYLKRMLDILWASIALIVLSPVMLVIAVAIFLEDGRPVIFRQLRVGRNGTPFEFFKFRSMPINTEAIPSSKARSLRITWVGLFIRRTNIDELPQLINILRGDMSLVGPRPALLSQVELCSMRKANGANECYPGLTGLAQVNSYDNMPEKEKAKWDGIYSNRITFPEDVRIILKTIRYLVSPPPVY